MQQSFMRQAGRTIATAPYIQEAKCKPMIMKSLPLMEVIIRILILRPLKGKGRVLIRVYINVESYLAHLPQEMRLCRLLQKPPEEQ